MRPSSGAEFGSEGPAVPAQAGEAVGGSGLVLSRHGANILCRRPVGSSARRPVPASFLISLGVGIAAGLATADDVGRREMIGLAATARIAILPAWFGISFVFGFSPLETSSPALRAVTFLVNVATIVAVGLATYAAARDEGGGAETLYQGVSGINHFEGVR